MVLPTEQEDNQKEPSRAARQPEKVGADRKRFSLRRFPLYFLLGLLIHYLFYLVRVRPWVFSNYVTWVIFSLVFACVMILAELGIKLFGFGRGDQKE